MLLDLSEITQSICKIVPPWIKFDICHQIGFVKWLFSLMYVKPNQIPNQIMLFHCENIAVGNCKTCSMQCNVMKCNVVQRSALSNTDLVPGFLSVNDKAVRAIHITDMYQNYFSQFPFLCVCLSVS